MKSSFFLLMAFLFIFSKVDARENHEAPHPKVNSSVNSHCTCTIVTTTPLRVEVAERQNTQPIMGALTDKFILPFFVAVITYFLFKKYDDNVKRRQYSTLGVAIIESLLEEVNTGIHVAFAGR